MFEFEKLLEFAKESNEIESIFDSNAHDIHAQALVIFLSCPKITVGRLVEFVKAIQPNACLRTESHHQVRVGEHVAPTPVTAKYLLTKLLKQINGDEIDPCRAHMEYEYIHPFMDGNGRSGRAIWLWIMLNNFYNAKYIKYPFLQKFYYQTLSLYGSNFIKKYDGK